MNKKGTAWALGIAGMLAMYAGGSAAYDQYRNSLNQLGQYFGAGSSFFTLLFAQPMFLVGAVLFVGGVALEVSGRSGAEPRETSRAHQEQTTAVGWADWVSSAGVNAVSRALAARDAARLVQLLDDSDPRVRSAAQSGLVSLGKTAREAVLAAMQSASPKVRARACAIAGQVGLADEDSTSLLMSCLGDPQRRVRTRAAEAIGQIGHAGSVDALRRLSSDPEPEVRDAASRALAQLPGASAAADTKVCPFCAETIKLAAIKCRFCGSDLAPTSD